MVKQDQIIFLEGKEKGLKKLFSQDCFGWLAIGKSLVDGDNGFENPDNDLADNGFNELSIVNDSPSYARIPLNIVGDSIKDLNTGKATVKFTADLDIDNITEGIAIDQLAIVDSSDSTDTNTTIYAASTFPKFTKSEKIAITFLISMTI